MTTIEINNDFGGSVKFVNENTIKYNSPKFQATWELKERGFYVKDCSEYISEYLKRLHLR